MIKINTKKIFILFFYIFLLFSIYYLKSIFKPILFSVFIAYLLNPFVEYLKSKGVNYKFAVLFSILIVLFLFFIIVILIVPGLIKDLFMILQNFDEFKSLIENFKLKIGYNSLPYYFKSAVDNSIFKVQLFLSSYTKNLFKDIIEFSMEMPTYILTPVFVYYFLTDKLYLLKILKSFIPYSIRNKVIELACEIDKVIGNFIKSQIILSVIIFILTLFSMIILNIKYPLIIAFINGIANIIPYFGPIIGLLPAFLSAFSQSVEKAFIVMIVFFIIQEVESGILAPKLMGETLGIHPVFIMILLLIGGKFFGALGLILSVPIAGIIKVTYNYIIRSLY